MLTKTGIPTKEDLLSKFPSQSALLKPKALLECYQDIPCNPCETSCPFHAITIGKDINLQPVLNEKLCTGCGICISSCPGLAIMVVQILKDSLQFKIPYEFLPIPKKGQIWHALNRAGQVIGDALILSVILTSKQDKTALVTVSVEKKNLYEFVTIRCPNEN
ncbi:MAG: 4Fe-4S binding protein [Firmicutes bacterium]|nr:4Fe-4S binding protein [Bacillota bacterium]